VLRGAKKLYFTSKLETNAGNPKKTWETLNEILGKSRKTDKIEKININGTPSSNPTEIANHFNNFFTSIGQQISDNVPPVEKKLKIMSTITDLSQICYSKTPLQSMY
jgi:hypothetical protein